MKLVLLDNEIVVSEIELPDSLIDSANNGEFCLEYNDLTFIYHDCDGETIWYRRTPRFKYNSLI